MRSNCTSSKRQLKSGRNYLSKVGKYLSFRTFSTSAFSFDNHFTTWVSSIHFSCFDAESVISESEKPLLLDRGLEHSLSAPAIRPHSPSVASTKCLSLTSEDVECSPSTFSLRTKSLPTALDERASPPALKPNTKRCWSWNLLKGDEHPRSSPTFLWASSAPSQKSLNTLPSSNTTFVPHPPLSAIFPASVHDLQLGPVISKESDISDDMDFPPDPKTSRRKSLNKLSRTLGVPLEDFEPRDTLRPATKSRRMTLSHITTSAGVTSGVSPSSRKSLSTLNTDDFHFNLADDLSDYWAEIRPGSRASVFSPHSPISPIIFNPPTPVNTQLHRPLPSTESSRPHAHMTLNRSCFMSVCDSPSSSIKVNGPQSSHDEVCKARNFVVAHPEYIEEFRTWSNQWN